MADRNSPTVLKPKQTTRPVADPHALRKQIEEFRRSQAQVIRDSITELQANRDEVERQAKLALEELGTQINEFERLLNELERGMPGEGVNGGATAQLSPDEQLKADARRVVQELRASGSWIRRDELAKLVHNGDVEAALGTFSADDFESRGSGDQIEYRWVGL